MEKFQRNLLIKIEDELLTMQRAGIDSDAENYVDLPVDTKQEYSEFKNLTDWSKIEDDQTCSLPYNFLLLLNSWLTFLVMLEAALLIKLKRSDFDPDIQQAKRNVSMALGYRHAINAPT